MKKRILLVISVLLVCGLAVAAYAYSANTPDKAGMSCCCKGADSCPMMKDKTAGKDAASCCDKEDCCCKGDSCAMKDKTAGKDEASCCDKEDAESCSMMKDKKDDGKAAKPSCCDKEKTPKKDG
jgi:hypothetical protein